MMNALNFAKKLISSREILTIEQLNRFRKRRKIVVFVPAGKVDEIVFAMSSSGAGNIGKYSMCSFQLNGTGTFKGGKSTKPVIGKKGRLEKIDEVRLEMVCNEDVLEKVIEKMLKVHPYEEPAYEIYEIISGEKVSKEKAVKINLKKAVDFKSIIGGLNNKIDKSFLDNKKKFKSVIIDFDNRKNDYFIKINKKEDILKITKSNSGEFIISFI